MLNLAWMSTARGSGSLSLLRFVCDRIREGSLDARIQVVVSNREPGEAEQTDVFFQFCREQGLPVVSESSRRFRQAHEGSDWRTSFDKRLAERIDRYDIDVVLLAGYMLIVSDFLCERYPLLNLHPALPDGPKGTWPEVMSELAQSGAEQTGAMIHVVTPELDRGPVVSYFLLCLAGEPYATLREGNDLDGLAREIRARELEREHPLILTTLQALSSGRVRMVDRYPYDESGAPLHNGMDLSAEVEDLVSRLNTA